MTVATRYLEVPLEGGAAFIPMGIRESDFQLLLETLKLWETRIVQQESEKLPERVETEAVG
jgi:hypothetical protein